VNLITLLALSLALAGCAGSPDPVFYALSPREGTVLASQPLKIEVRRPGLPGYLDRPHIVRRVTPERLELAADERWGAPLEAMVGGTLADNLAERLPSCMVYTEAGAVASPADVQVEVEVSRFELTADGSVKLLAEVAVHWTTPDGTRIERHALSARPSSRSTADLVRSMSGLLGLLSDTIAAIIQKGSPAERARPVPDPTAPLAAEQDRSLPSNK
jgi:uncharacterized protein